MKRKSRVAVLGGGAHTIPSYRMLLTRLALDFEIVVISEFPIDSGRDVPYRIASLRNKWLKNRIGQLAYLLFVLFAFVKRRFDLIHSHSTFPSGWVALIARALFKTPVLVSLDAAEAFADPSIGFGDLSHPTRSRINGKVCHQSDSITCLSHFQRATVVSAFKISPERIHVIPRGVDGFVNNRRNRIEEPVTFLQVAYQHRVKDQETLLRAYSIIAQHIESRLIILGKDYEEGRIHQFAAGLGLTGKVEFPGFVPHEKVADYFQRADVLLQTSRYESYGMSAVEAMASGVLVCGTHVGILADLADTCCLTVPVGSDELLANRVMELLSDGDQQQRLRRNALEWCHKHSLDWTATRYKEVYRSLIGQA